MKTLKNFLAKHFERESDRSGNLNINIKDRLFWNSVLKG